jgi:hypothetical protein
MSRGFQADKDLARRARGTGMTQILNQGRTYIPRQRQSFQSLTLAAHEYVAALPIQIIQGHGPHFSTAQPQARQEQQDRVIALT